MHLCTFVFEVEKNFMPTLSTFYCFFGDKKWLLKALLAFTFILLLLNYFDLPATVQNLGRDTH